MEWRPHPRQEEALKRIEFEILYGGARGGGKTDAGLVWLTDHVDNPRYRALVIRKNADDLSDWVDRAVRFYKPLGANITYRPAVIKFPSGATIHTGHLKDDQAYTKYQGQEYQRILIEELTQIPDEKRYLQLLGSCRSTIPEIRPQVFCTTNPGGLGHIWVRTRFVDPNTPNIAFIGEDTGRSRIYIPATVDDNPTLVDNDPGYVQFLEGLKSKDVELWKAWRLGDWSTFAGQFFKEWRTSLHIIPAFNPTPGDFIVGGMDWGYTNPFSLHLSVIEKLIFGDKTEFYRARTFFEIYGTEKTPQAWSEDIVEELSYFKLTLRDISWIRADPAMFNKKSDGSKSIRDQFIDADEDWRIMKPANNDRLGGWSIMHNWLSIAPDGLPYWQVGNNCVDLIRTLPGLVHDETKVEDVDTDGEDHAADDERYQFKHLKWIDAGSGAFNADKKDESKKNQMANIKEGKQISIDLSVFENMGSGSNGIIRTGR